MTDHDHAPRDAILWGWKVFRANLGPMLISSLVIVAMAVVLNVASFGANILGKDHPRDLVWFLALSGLLGLINNLLSWFIQVGVIRISLGVAKGRPVEQSNLFTTKRFWPYVFATLLVTVGSAIGAVLLVIPGLVFFWLSMFFGWFVIDREMGPVGAIGASWRLVRDNAKVCASFFGLFILCYVVGALALVVGLLVTVPVSQFALAYMYLHLHGETPDPNPVPPPKKAQA